MRFRRAPGTAYKPALFLPREPSVPMPKLKSVPKPLSVPVAAALILGVAGAAAAPSPDAAQGGKAASQARFLDQSLASQLVQSLAQRRIFEADDKADASCRDREFLQAVVVGEPNVVRAGGVDVRKWQEDWTLRRCDRTVLYRVFYSEVGQGGVTFSIAPHGQPAAETAVAAAGPEPKRLALQKPPVRGAEVVAVQKALIAAGYRLEADGIYGPGTQKAVRQFQQARGLGASGAVDARTREALGLL
mgnify:CR=1 FL=1